MEEKLPPGFRFHPTDEELITSYLTKKLSDSSFTSKAIVDVDLNKSEPWDLPAKASVGEKQWYFFSVRDRKYPTGFRTNRATVAGYWKTTGKDKEIYRHETCVGWKKTLVFYKGRAPNGEKSNWVMHEYRLDNKITLKPSKEEWVVCRVFQKNSSTKRSQEAQSSNYSPAGSQCDASSMVNGGGEGDPVAMNALTDPLSNAFTANSSPQTMHTTGSNLSALQWSSNILGSNQAMNSLLIKAMQLRNFQQQLEHPFWQGFSSQFGVDQTSNVHLSAPSNDGLGISATHSQQAQPYETQFMW